MNIDGKFIQEYKEIIISILIIILFAIIGIRQIVVSIQKVQTTKIEHKKQTEKLKESSKKLDGFKKAKQKMLDKQNKLKPVFEQRNAPEDSLSSFGGMFDDIIDYIKMNNMMLRTVQYIINPSEDQIYSRFPMLYNVCKIRIFAVGTYTQLQGFLRDLTVYPYFINVSEIEIKPYDKNPNYILINISVNVYSKKQQSATSVLK